MPINAIKYHTYVSPVPEEAVQEEEINTDELREKIRQLEAEKKQLRMQLYDANRRSQNALDELSKIRSATEKDRCELAELRTLVFREQHEEQSEVPDDTISFPYYTNKKVIIVGGSDSWRNEMSKRLPDVSFVKPDTMPDPRLMRNADEIWFQTHYMSHNLYDTVKSQVSGYPIKINYFLAKGVAKCAEELVKYHCA